MRFAKLCKLISLLLCLLLLGCSAEEDPNAGKYLCYEVMSDGVSLRPEEVFQGEISLRLDNGGKGIITLGGEGGAINWKLEGENLNVAIKDSLCQGSLKDGMIGLRLYDSDTVLYFAREGLEVPKPDGSGFGGLEGEWYGLWRISGAQEAWEGYEGQWYDLCAIIESDEHSEGRIKLWDEDYSADNPMALVYLAPDEKGNIISTGGYFIAHELAAGEWLLESTASGELVISGAYSGEGGSFDYELVLRPWGALWDDVPAEDLKAKPYFYEDWYLPLIEAGATMPSAIDHS